MEILKQLLQIGASRVFHGTPVGDAIMQGGFRPSTQGTLGPGVYATDDASVARGYGYGRALNQRLNPRTATQVLEGSLSNRAQLLSPDKYFKMSPADQAMARKQYVGLAGRRSANAAREILFFDPKHANTVFGTSGQMAPIPKISRLSTRLGKGGILSIASLLNDIVGATTGRSITGRAKDQLRKTLQVAPNINLSPLLPF
jgi:hypothetical protein